MKTDFTDILAPLVESVTQLEVYRRTGIHQSTLSMWLSGKRDMPLENQLRIAVACGCKVTVKVEPPK